MQDHIETALTYLNYPLIELDKGPITLASILLGCVIFALAYQLSRMLRRSIRALAVRRGVFGDGSLYTVERLTHYFFIILGLFMALSAMGIDLGKIALVVSALSLGIGFGLQAIFSNFVSGLIILLERSLKVGDYIQLESGVMGVVTEIRVRATVVTTLENTEVIVPNSEFVNGKVTNWTHTSNYCRLRIPFGVAYGTDKERLSEVVLTAVRELPQTLHDIPAREPVIVMKGFGDSSLDFELLVWVKPGFTSQQSSTRSAYLWTIDTALNETGIVVPFPQRDVHMVAPTQTDAE
ncbi:MAG: mechanosensitive ion channel family protein [Spongiibacteraceae bacterium]